MPYAEVLLQLADALERKAAFRDVPTGVPANLVVLPARAADAQAALDLYEALFKEFQALGTETAFGPAGRVESERQNLLVLVASNSSGPASDPGLLDAWVDAMAKDPDGSCRILPVAPEAAGMDPIASLDERLRAYNVAWLHAAIEELVPEVLQAAGVVVGEFRAFVSYKRSDCESLAEGLFGRLVKEGFSVFLDRFSVPRGAAFQRILTEQLEDKSMVVVLETSNFTASPWTQFEVAFAKRRRLGICCVTFPNAAPPRERDLFEPERRLQLTEADFDPPSAEPVPDAVLSKAGMERVVRHIKAQHNLAYVRRRQLIRKELDLALARHRLGPSRPEVEGWYSVPSKRAKIVISPRPAELSDFYNGAERSPTPVVTGATLVLITPYLKLGALRRAHLDWVNRQAKALHIDPLRLPALAAFLASRP